MNLELLKSGILLMIIGMGVVYFFLTIMIYGVGFSSKIISIASKYFPEEVEEDITVKKKTSSTSDSEIALDIACAVAERSRA